MKIETLAVDSLHLHPLLKSIPPAPEEFEESLLLDLDERGQDYPLLVDEKNRVIDGRARLRAAVKLNWSELKISRVTSGEAATLIVHTLCQRRHFTKLARAYVTLPLFDGLICEGKARQLAGLKRGSAPVVQFLYDGKNKQAIADRIGVSAATLAEAMAIHRYFGECPKAKELFEPKILNGELGTGKAIVAIAGHISTAGKPRGQNEQLSLFQSAFHLASVRFATRWQNLGAADQGKVLAQYTTEFLPSLPPEFHRAYQRFLRSQKQEAAR